MGSAGFAVSLVIFVVVGLTGSWRFAILVCPLDGKAPRDVFESNVSHWIIETSVYSLIWDL